MNMTKDLTIGEPRKVLWKFCLPLFGSIIFQQLYNLADSFVAGKFIGEEALAAVGNGYEITLIFIAFAFGCNIGGSIISARYFGAKDYENVKTTIWTTLFSSLFICLLLMLCGFFLCNSLLNLIHTPENIFADCRLYLMIYIGSLPFVFLYNVSEGIFSSLGDSKTPFIFLACSSLANIAMDILFVASFKMGVAGVAWATFICQGISCILAVLFLIFKLKKIKTTKKYALFSWAILKSIAIVAIPSILQQSFISVGNIIIQSIINTFGSSVIAGYSAAIKLNNLVTTSLTTLGNGISNFTSQNLGAEKPKRVKSGMKSGLFLVWILCIPLVLLYCLLGKELVCFFMDSPSELAISTGKQFLLVVSPFYFVISAKLVLDGILRGAKMMNKFMIATFADLIIRVVLADIFSVCIGVNGIWWAWPIGWCISVVLSYLFYRSGPWIKQKLEPISL